MSNPIFKTVGTFSFLVLLSGIIQAQTQPADSNSLKPGAWAFQFGVAGNFTLTSFQGATLALKYHYTESNAVRAAITINGTFTDGSGLQKGLQYDSISTTASNDNSTHSAGLSLIVQYLWYMNPRDVIHLYVGVGPAVSYSHDSRTENRNALTSADQFYSSGYYWTHLKTTSTSNQWALGLRGVGGGDSQDNCDLPLRNADRTMVNIPPPQRFGGVGPAPSR